MATIEVLIRIKDNLSLTGMSLSYAYRCFLCINPEVGTKCSQKKLKDGKQVVRKKNTINPHVSTFLNVLADYEWKCM